MLDKFEANSWSLVETKKLLNSGMGRRKVSDSTREEKEKINMRIFWKYNHLLTDIKAGEEIKMLSRFLILEIMRRVLICAFEALF